VDWDYIITIPPGATGQGRVDSLLNTLTPTNSYRYRLPVLLVNDSPKGGSGGVTLVVSTHISSFPGILTHEFGHVFAGLGDEYSGSVDHIETNSFPAEPNTTTNTSFASIPWKAWIDTNSTPIPTPNYLDGNPYFNDVGLFEGAHYSLTNWYRPKLNCRMRSVDYGIPFCEVCREALVKMVYSKVRSIEAATPTNALITMTPTPAIAFSVTPLQPATHNLGVQWRTNGVNVAGATNTTFSLAAQGGLTNLSVVVRDATDWVRNDPANVTAATNVWSLASLWLESPQAVPVDQFRFTVRGSGVTNFAVKASSDLNSWTSIATNALVGGQFNFTNSGLTNPPWRFYRVVSPP